MFTVNVELCSTSDGPVRSVPIHIGQHAVIPAGVLELKLTDLHGCVLRSHQGYSSLVLRSRGGMERDIVIIIPSPGNEPVHYPTPDVFADVGDVAFQSDVPSFRCSHQLRPLGNMNSLGTCKI